MAYHTTYHLFILFLNVWNFTHFFDGFPKVLEVYKNCVTQYFIFGENQLEKLEAAKAA